MRPFRVVTKSTVLAFAERVTSVLWPDRNAFRVKLLLSLIAISWMTPLIWVPLPARRTASCAK